MENPVSAVRDARSAGDGGIFGTVLANQWQSLLCKCAAAVGFDVARPARRIVGG